MTPKQTSHVAAPSAPQKRAPWRKKTPVEVFLAQAENLRREIDVREKELTALRRQLEQFEEARKVFERS